MAKIKIEGLDKLQKKLKDNVTLDDVKRVVKTNGSQLQARIEMNADFTRGYQTGQTKRSINLEFKDGGMTADSGVDKMYTESGKTTKYAPYVEYGTRHMDAQPFVRPAYAEQAEKFKKDMQKLVR